MKVNEVFKFNFIEGILKILFMWKIIYIEKFENKILQVILNSK